MVVHALHGLIAAYESMQSRRRSGKIVTKLIVLDPQLFSDWTYDIDDLFLVLDLDYDVVPEISALVYTMRILPVLAIF